MLFVEEGINVFERIQNFFGFMSWRQRADQESAAAALPLKEGDTVLVPWDGIYVVGDSVGNKPIKSRNSKIKPRGKSKSTRNKKRRGR